MPFLVCFEGIVPHLQVTASERPIWISQKIKLFLLLLVLLLETLQQYLFVRGVKYSSLLQVLLRDVAGQKKETIHNRVLRQDGFTPFKVGLSACSCT